MKFSVKLPDGDDSGSDRHSYPIAKAKIPIYVMSQPFATTISTATTTPYDHFAVSLSTAFRSGPSLKISYSPNETLSAASMSKTPFSVVLKSGIGSFGSPNDSPLLFSAKFPVSPSNLSAPIFSLHLKPQIGNFCLRKSLFSNHKCSDQDRNLKCSEGISDGGIPNDEIRHDETDPNGGIVSEGSSSPWEEVKLEPIENFASSKSIVSLKNRNSFCGISFHARTILPVTKRCSLKFRWGVNLPAMAEETMSMQMPYLTVQMVEIAMGGEAKETVDSGESGFVKGMCLRMKLDLEAIKKENRLMKQWLEEMRMGAGKGMQNGFAKGVSLQLSNSRVDSAALRKKKPDKVESWRGLNLSSNRSAEVESELRKSIKSASSS